MTTVPKLASSPLWLAVLGSLMCGCGGTGIPTGAVSGTIKLNGQPVQGVQVTFTPKAKVRPSEAITDAQGRYKAQFVSSQSGVALGPCVVQLSIFRGGNYERNYLPAAFNTDAASNPEFNLNVTEDGVVFDYDIKFEGKIPPYTPDP